MASFLTRNLIQNQTRDIQFEGSVLGAEGNVLKPHKKSTTLGGKNAGTTRGTRKPLQDLNNRNNYGSMGSVDIVSSKSNKSLLKNENVFKPEEKVKKSTLARKPLGDLTNSKKSQLKDTTKKNNLKGKVSVLKEEKVLPNEWIAEEGFLHNHKECKAQRQAMSMEYYLELVGLRKEFTPLIVESQLFPMPPTSPKREISWEYDTLPVPDVASPRLSLSPTWSPHIDWGDMGSDLNLKASPPRK